VIVPVHKGNGADSRAPMTMVRCDPLAAEPRSAVVGDRGLIAQRRNEKMHGRDAIAWIMALK